MSGNQVALRQVRDVRELFAHPATKKRLTEGASKAMAPDRLLAVMTGAIRENPDLGKVEPMSLLGAMMTCSQLGMEPNSKLGECYLIPFKNNRRGVYEVQFILGYRGMIALAYRSGKVRSLIAGVHYDDDDLWDYERGTEFRLRHREGPQEGEPLHAYALAELSDGGWVSAVLPWSKILETRNASQGWKRAVSKGNTATSPWGAHIDAMAMKTAIRRLFTWLPKAPDLIRAQDVDESPKDFRAFGIDPTLGEAPDTVDDAEDDGTIEGTAEDVPAEGEREVPPPRRERPKPGARDGTPYDERNAKPRGKETAPEPPAADEGDAGAEFATVRDRILEELETCDPSDVDDILSTFGLEVEQMRAVAPAMAEEIDAAAEEARKRGDDE